ncbi:M23 family metallopeptidase [Pseudonocardia sp. KRD291]|uniref:M23 family metallopeptidase n=1 Tax=Pseudonocardia sp. KRD291 TaxID=2792007 RepID=UPI001CF78FED|nr:M23 family metallopeptidase [Pseudonocardia sp. KRD291]
MAEGATQGWAPIAMSTALERHDQPETRPQPAAAGLTPTPLGTETHGIPELESLAKADRLADKIAAVALTRTRALAGGAPEAALSDSGDVFVTPTVGTVTSAAGPRWGATHYGLDIANDVGTPIFAVGDGEVIDAGPASGFGLWVRIRHPDGSISIYGHINRSLVQKGQSVRAGDRIALMGNRGQSTGPHLHLEIRDESGNKRDPQAWLRTRGLTVR